MSLVKVPVSIAGDTSCGASFHSMMTGPDVFDCPASMDWPAGKPVHALSSTRPVAHKSQYVALEPHDLGFNLPHIGERFMAAAGSSRTIPFSASTVLVNGHPTACTAMWPWFPMALCGSPFKCFVGVNLDNGAHSVFVGMNAFDLIRGAILVAAEIVKDTIKAIISITSTPKLDFGTVWSAGGGKSPQDVAIDAAVDFYASVAISGASGWERPISAKAEISVGGFSAGGEVKYKVEGPLGALELVSGRPVTRLTGDESAPKVVEASAQGRTPVSKHEARWVDGEGGDTSSTWVDL